MSNINQFMNGYTDEEIAELTTIMETNYQRVLAKNNYSEDLHIETLMELSAASKAGDDVEFERLVCILDCFDSLEVE